MLFFNGKNAILIVTPFKQNHRTRMKGASVREKIGCFSCNRAVGWGEHFVCISRLRRVRSKQGDDEIVNAVASLQVCSYCVARARLDKITFNEEVPLLEMEMAGFYWFVRRLAKGGEPWGLVAEENHCTLCKSPIKVGDHYTEINVTEEVPEQERPVEVLPEFEHRLAVICDSCAGKHMVWWYDAHGNIIDVV
jgi:hypothetical protein